MYATPINVDDLRIRITAEINILKENLDLMKKSNEKHENKSIGLRKWRSSRRKRTIKLSTIKDSFIISNTGSN